MSARTASPVAEVARIETDDFTVLIVDVPQSPFPVEILLAGSPHRWAARAAVDRFYDGLTDQPLRWDGETFVVVGEVAVQHVPTPQRGLDEGRLRLDISVLHQATNSLEIGGTVVDCASALLGTNPTGWGVAEPATQPWSQRELTDSAAIGRRSRAPSSWSPVRHRGALWGR